MKDIPIIFSGPMVRALLEGRKTMTRRVLNRLRVAATPESPSYTLTGDNAERALLDAAGFRNIDSNLWAWSAKAFDHQAPAARTHWHASIPYAVGDRLWVRENHQFRGADYGDSGGEIEWFRTYGYGGAADNWDPEFPDAWEPSCHAGVRKLVEPDEQEGSDVAGYVTKLLPSIHMPRWASRLTLIVTGVKVERLQDISEEDAIAEGVERNIDGNYGVRGPLGGWLGNTFATAREAFSYLWMSLHGAAAWEANPWVVAPTFHVVKANIDAQEARAA